MSSQLLTLKLSKITKKNIGQRIRTFGWIEKTRSAGKVGLFIDLTFGFKTIKCLASNDVEIVTKNIANNNDLKAIDASINELEHENCANINDLNAIDVNKNDLDIANSANINDLKAIDASNNNNDLNINESEPKKDHNIINIDIKKESDRNLTPHTSIHIEGTVQPNFSKKDNHDFEIHIEKIIIYQQAPPFPINIKTGLFAKLENGHLWLQTNERKLFLKARSQLLHFMRQYYYTNEYCEVTPPTLVQTQVEGGSTLFSLNYYNEKSYLTQSSQLYLETVIAASEKCYCIMPSYRAEKFNTTRHLSEYTHVEAELGNISFDDLLIEIESFIRYSINSLAEKMRGEIEIDTEVVNGTFKKITYTYAIEVLRNNGVFKDKEEGVEYRYGDDISDRDEIMLVEILGGKPVFLINFPVEHKPFYCRRAKPNNIKEIENYEKIENNNNDGLENNKNIGLENNNNDGLENNNNGRVGVGLENNNNNIGLEDGLEDGLEMLKINEVTESVDLLWPGIGEILGGSMRVDDYKELMDGFKRENIDPTNYYWYTDLRLYGANTHGGYGLGFERLLRAVMKYDTVNKACLYPRFPGRCRP